MAAVRRARIPKIVRIEPMVSSSLEPQEAKAQVGIVASDKNNNTLFIVQNHLYSSRDLILTQ